MMCETGMNLKYTSFRYQSIDILHHLNATKLYIFTAP